MPVLNGIASKPDDRDYKFLPSLAPRPNTDLRPYLPPIRDQALENACTSHQPVAVCESMTIRTGQYEELAEQFLYNVVGSLEGLPPEAGRYSLRDNLEAVRRFGLPLESEFPYMPSNVGVTPDAATFASAATRKVFRYEAIDLSNSMLLGTNPQISIDNINSALAADLPVMVTLGVGEKIFGMHGPLEQQVGQYWPFDMAGALTGNPLAGVHSITLGGNRDDLGGWIGRNQWNKSYGDAGYMLVPYTCIRDISEAWVIQQYRDINLIPQRLDAVRKKLVGLYVAILNRAPELGGFKWWTETVMGAADEFYALSDAATGMMADTESRARFVNNGQIMTEVLNSLSGFENRCAVAEYYVVDMAGTSVDMARQALDGVTADPATVDIAKLMIRRRRNGQGGVL